MHHPPWHFLAVLLVLLHLLAAPRPVCANSVEDGRFGNRTLEGCTSSEDCASNLFCFEVIPPRNNLVDCNPVFSEHPCHCFPLGQFLACKTSQDWCPRREGCGNNKVTNESGCIACSVLFDGSSNFVPVDEGVCVSSPTPFPTPSPSPTGPLRRTLDLCSPTDCCDDDLVCTGSVDGQDCDTSSAPCRCMSKEMPECKSTADCHERDVCSLNLITNAQLCASCNVLLSVPSLTTADPFDTTCVGFTKRPAPSYPPTDNGRSLEHCDSDFDCTGSLQCFANVLTGESCSFRSFVCVCGTPNGKPCQRSNQCLVGESCATLLRINRTECVSNAVLERNNPDELIIKSTDPLPQGTGLTSDPCMVDWDCQGDRRCTHDQELFGGCRGRRACTCLGVTFTLCTSTEDCPSGELCTQSAGSRLRPYCMSRNAVARDDLLYEFDVDDEPVTVVGGGFSEDACLTSSDCEGDRVCRHFLETKGSCKGDRNGCICKSKKGVKCKSSDDCVPEEICLRMLDDTTTNSKRGACVSRDRADSYPYSSIYEEFGAPSPSPGEPTAAPSPSPGGPTAAPSPSPGGPTAAPSPSPGEPMASPSAVSSVGPMPPTISATPSIPPSVTVEDPTSTETAEPSGPEDDPTPSASFSSTASAISSTASASFSSSASATATVSVSAPPPGPVVGANPTDPGLIDGPGETDESEGSDEPVCVDAELLKGMDQSKLVFAQHRRASVLCDRAGSCATPGHMVVYKGDAMMMRSYCGTMVEGGCTRVVRWVNSPKMGRAVRVASDTNSLSMTALAARYETFAEEVALAQLVRVGF